MNWEQKYSAIAALAGSSRTSLMRRGTSDWYVNASSLSRKEGGVLSGGLQHGVDPEDAVAQWWDWATDPKYYLVRGHGLERKAVKWNGFMWEDVDEQSI